MKRRIALFTGCFLLILSAHNASAQNQYEQQVLTQLDQVGASFTEIGYDIVVRKGDSLKDGETKRYTVNLTSGTTYSLVGVCDVDCSDLDLTLFDDNNNLIVEDTMVDDAPVIEFEALETGQFSLDVKMYDCSEDICYYGVALFERAEEASNEYERQVLRQLDAAADRFVKSGYTKIVHEGDALGDGETEPYSVSLTKGNTYALVGVCDVDCSDIDLTLFDDNENLIVEDTLVDDAPIIEFTVLSSGNFKLNVTMYDCSASMCYYGVALFRK